MKLTRKRQIFTHYFCQLVVWGNQQPGIDIIVDEVRRGRQQAEWNARHCRQPRQNSRCQLTQNAHIHQVHGGHTFKPIGIVRSLHNSGLAGDLLVYKDQQLLPLSKDYAFLGEWWENHTSCFEAEKVVFCWGGRFSNPDGGHFSLAHGKGRR